MKKQVKKSIQQFSNDKAFQEIIVNDQQQAKVKGGVLVGIFIIGAL